MKLPKYIERLLDRRARLAIDLMAVDYKITEFINKYNIEVESYDYCTGVEIYANPYDSARRVKEAILNHNKEKRIK